jgi:hypothetical protein
MEPERNYLVNQGVDGRIILRRMLRKYAVRIWSGFIWLRIVTSEGALVNTVMNHRVPENEGNLLTN